jgi:hypothetical protein
MYISIPDYLSGPEKRKRIIIQQVVYAMEKFKSRKEAAIFLGYSYRTLTQWVAKYDELKQYRDNDENKERGLTYAGREFKPDLWKTRIIN